MVAESLHPGILDQPRWWQFRRRAELRILKWSVRRRPREKGPVELHRRRIYIVPTRMGYTFGFLVFVMLMGSMNYMNSLAFALTFLLTGLGLVTMHHTHQNLLSIKLNKGQQDPVFAGQTARFRILAENPTDTDRYSLAVHWIGTDPVSQFDMPARQTTAVDLSLPADHRGMLPAPRFTIHTTFPLGLFYAWCYVELDMYCLVYPAPADNRLQAPPSHGKKGGRHNPLSGQEDFAGLRDYQRKDPPRLIHWKAYPRARQLVVKQFADPQSDTLWLDWTKLTGMDTEARLSQICRWVLDAHRSGRQYGLRMPGLEIPPACDEVHRHRCLEHLALFES